MKYTIIILIILTSIITGCSQTNNFNANDNTSGTNYALALELYKQKKYDDVLTTLKSSVSLDTIHSTETDDEEALFLISYIKHNAFDSNYGEALKYTEYLRPIDNVLTPQEISDIKKAYPQLQSAAESTVAGEKYNAEQQELEDRKNSGIEIGMTKEDVLKSSWGKPTDSNKTTTKYGVSEQWIYDDNRYVYFDDGIVTAIQE